MTPRDETEQLVLDAMDEVAELLPPGSDWSAGSDEPLMEAHGGCLDSLGVVNLMVAVESRIEQRFGRSVSLAEAFEEPPESSPFRSVATLTEYLEARIEDGDHG